MTTSANRSDPSESKKSRVLQFTGNSLPGMVALLLAWSGPATSAESQWPFEIATAALESVPLMRNFDGTVQAVHQATVSAQTSGRIAAVNYDVDDYVEAGSVLIRFTDVEQQSALQQAEAGLKEARALLAEAIEERRRAQNLLERELGSQREVDRTLAASEAADARVSATASVVDAARQQVE
jgi:multidrug efflux pump subunit AcrA (membrane-fusion protein)